MNVKLIASIINRPLGRLVLGSAGGYAIVLLVSPIITRVYSPEHFGQFAVFSSFVAIASIISSLSLELGILSSKNREEARQYVIWAVSVVGYSTFALLFLLIALSAFGVDLILPGWAFLLAIASCSLVSLSSIAINWSIYSSRTELAARAVFASLSGRSLSQVGLGYAVGGLTGLVLGEVAGRLLGLATALNWKTRLTANREVNWRVFSRHQLPAVKPYVLYVTPSAAMDAALVWLPAPLCSLAFGPFVGGLIAMTQRFGSVPLTIANQSIGQLFHRRAAEKFGSDNSYLFRFVMISIISLIGLTILAVLVLRWQGKLLFGALLGSAWSETYIAVIGLAPLYCCQFVSVLTNRIMLVSGRANVKFLASVAQLLVLLGSVLFAKSMDLPWERGIFVIAGSLALTQCLAILYVLCLLLNDGGQGCTPPETHN